MEFSSAQSELSNQQQKEKYEKQIKEGNGNSKANNNQRFSFCPPENIELQKEKFVFQENKKQTETDSKLALTEEEKKVAKLFNQKSLEDADFLDHHDLLVNQPNNDNTNSNKIANGNNDFNNENSLTQNSPKFKASNSIVKDDINKDMIDSNFRNFDNNNNKNVNNQKNFAYSNNENNEITNNDSSINNKKLNLENILNSQENSINYNDNSNNANSNFISNQNSTNKITSNTNIINNNNNNDNNDNLDISNNNKQNSSKTTKNLLSDLNIEENNANFNTNKNNNENINLNLLNDEDLRCLESGAFACSDNQNTELKTRENRIKDKGGVLYESVRERKTYEEKVIILQTRLKKLKEQEEEINKKLKFEKKKVFKVDKIRNNVTENKKKYQLEKQQRIKEIERLKKELLIEKEKRKEKLNEAKETVKKEKEKKFSLIKKDRIVLNSLAESFKSQSDNMKTYNYYKNKQEEICSKVQRFKKYKEREDILKENFDSKIINEKNKTFDLKKKLEQLEELEVEYMKKLENTIIRNRKEFDNLEKTKGLNFSTVSLKIKQEILHRSDTQIQFESPSQKAKFSSLIEDKENVESKKNDLNEFCFDNQNNFDSFDNSNNKNNNSIQNYKSENKSNNASGNKNAIHKVNNHKIKVNGNTNEKRAKITNKTSIGISNSDKANEKSTKNFTNKNTSSLNNNIKTNENEKANMPLKKISQNIRKNNSITVFDRNSNYNTACNAEVIPKNNKSNKDNKGVYQSYLKGVGQNNQNSNVKNNPRKTASMDQKTNDLLSVNEYKNIKINSLNNSTGFYNSEFPNNDIVKKINFDEKPIIEKKIKIKK